MDEQLSVAEVEARIAQVQPTVVAIRSEVGRLLVGQRHMVDSLLVSLLGNGHVLLEGVPGLAKTTAVHAFAQAMNLDFQRIQFTPDLLPADLLGTQVYNPKDGGFTTHKGPLFANIILADEINRAPAKVQSALLQAMQERQITLADRTWPLPLPFLVLATQNPIEQEGTYQLPEAQADRFLLKVVVGYPTKAEEREILLRSTRPPDPVQPVADVAAILAAQDVVRLVRMESVVADYIVDLVHATRDPGSLPGGKEIARFVQFGASPRATLALAITARAHAFLEGRGFVTPDDVKAMGADVMRHRILLTYEAEAEGASTEQVIEQIFERVRTP
ncbi:MAG: MoxR family ATPase [Oligoflexia bacterium]|nr:MoxR family ATPase [Oligoflexia bacterium]